MADRKRPKGFQIFQDKKPPFKWRCYHRKTGSTIDIDKFPLWTMEFYGECYRISQLHEKSNAVKAGTLGALITKYRASPAFQTEISPRTRSDYQKCFDYLKSIENTPLTAFKPPLIVKIRDKAGESKGRKFGSYVRTVLSLLFAWGKERGEVKENPAAGIKAIKRPKNAPEANRPWMDSERDAVLAALPSHMLPAVTLMMFYGLDPQDAISLPRTAIRKGMIDTKRGKTGEAVMLPLLEPVSAALDAAPEHSAITLCANSHGKPWTVSGFRASWRPVRMALEEQGSVQPGLTLKGLRHTVATILREMNMDYGTIANVLGQKTEAMAKHYSRRADMSKQTNAAVKDFAAEVNRRKTSSVKPS
ncbi:tyrosine-type recombinase/integrase [Agrobacterium rosae]|uniref:Tyrosine-type recombinase/integrase n=1 Tax=Agrobacterium rosae TaxID=1972867 RepID=A0ABU4VVW5_9HYPH|nr:tyrosine-type recombinase/integrase [Agrobacterium rosae]MDX8329644.1 tyrosine-type recombinase/integrase [Agrobacterium rosae]